MESHVFDRDASEQLLKRHEAAAVLKVCEKTLYSMTWPRGSIRPVKIGRLVRYTPESLQEFIRERILCQTQPSSTTAA